MKVGYTPGSFYKRAQQTNMQKLNRQAVERYRSAVANAGSQLFSANAEASQGKSELIAEQVLLRVQSQAETASAAAPGLGALLNKSA